jgi:chitosanase
MISANQKDKIIKVLNVFETGTPEGRYHSVTVMADGVNRSRQITYGKSQTTEQGNLKTLLEMYIAAGGKYGEDFKPYISKIKVIPLSNDMKFRLLLRKSALEDAIMRNTQDDFFEQLYYQPAEQFFNGNNFQTALSMLVIYDSYIHSGGVPRRLRERFPERTPINGGYESDWTTAYVNTRHHWLANHGNILLRKTIYRTQCLKNQIETDNWDLQNPIMANGVRVG